MKLFKRSINLQIASTYYSDNEQRIILEPIMVGGIGIFAFTRILKNGTSDKRSLLRARG
jgi:hypothetical protein